MQPGPAPAVAQRRKFKKKKKKKLPFKFAGQDDTKLSIVGAKGNTKWDVIYPYGVEGTYVGWMRRGGSDCND
jgi:hypothetical protein